MLITCFRKKQTKTKFEFSRTFWPIRNKFYKSCLIICYRFFVKNNWFRNCVQSILPWLQNANKKPGSTLFPTVYVYDQFMTMQVNSESIASLRFLEFKHLHCLVTNHWMMSTSKLATLFDVSQSSCTGAGSQCYQAVYKVIIYLYTMITVFR